VDFDPTEEQRAYYDSVVRFARRALGDEGAVPFTTAWRRCAEFGIQGLAVPAAYGGSEAGALTIILAMEALGLGCRDNGLIFSINAQMWACQHPLARLGTEEQRRRYTLQSLLSGEGLVLATYRARFGTEVFEDLPELSELEPLGLARRDPARLRLTEAGGARSDTLGPWLYSEAVRNLMEEYAWR